MTNEAALLDDGEANYEEDLLRNPYIVKLWIRYLEYEIDKDIKKRATIYERALSFLPGSYKLWHAYLAELRQETRGKSPKDHIFEQVNRTYERCLVHLHKMPRIWLEYCEFLSAQKLITRTREGYDRALRSLAVTQHDRIWRSYVKFANNPTCPY